MYNASPVNNDAVLVSELIQNILINWELFNSQEASWQGPDSRTTLRQLFLQTDRKRERQFEIIQWWKLFPVGSFVLCLFEKQWALLSPSSDRMVSNLRVHVCVCMRGQVHTHARTAGNSLNGCMLKLFSIELLISSRAKISTQKWSVWGQKWFAIKEFPLSTEIWRRRRRKKQPVILPYGCCEIKYLYLYVLHTQHVSGYKKLTRCDVFLVKDKSSLKDLCTWHSTY